MPLSSGLSTPLSFPFGEDDASPGPGGGTPGTPGVFISGGPPGEDILFDKDFKVSPWRDYVLVSGIPNLRAAVLRRLITRPGEYKAIPAYGVGIESFVKKSMTTAQIKQLSLRIRDNLLQDTRIEDTEVQAEKVFVGGEPALKVFIKVKAKGQNHSLEPFTFFEIKGS